MRIVYVFASALALAVPAMAAAPEGFNEARVLEPAASFVAGKPTVVYCANDGLEWMKVVRLILGSNYNSRQVTGLTTYGDSSTRLSPYVCQTLRQKLAGRTTNLRVLAMSILALTHESIHMRGETNEGVTDCAAMHEMPRVAVKFFHVKPGKQLRTLMTAAWYVHRLAPAPYQDVC